MGVYDELMNLKRPEAAHPEAATEVVKTTHGIVMSSQPTAEPKNARLPESKIARKQESKKKLVTPGSEDSFPLFVERFLEMRSANNTSFRYPQEMLDLLADTIDDVRRQYGKRLTKNAIVVTALAYFLWDFEKNKEASVLNSTLLTRPS